MGALKPFIPYSTSSKNQVFHGSRFQATSWQRLRSVFEQLELVSGGFSDPSWCPLATLTGGPASKIRLVTASGGVGAFSGSRMGCGDVWGPLSLLYILSIESDSLSASSPAAAVELGFLRRLTLPSSLSKCLLFEDDFRIRFEGEKV